MASSSIGLRVWLSIEFNGPLDKNQQRPHRETETQPAITRGDETTSAFSLQFRQRMT